MKGFRTVSIMNVKEAAQLATQLKGKANGESNMEETWKRK